MKIVERNDCLKAEEGKKSKIRGLREQGEKEDKGGNLRSLPSTFSLFVLLTKNNKNRLREQGEKENKGIYFRSLLSTLSLFVPLAKNSKNGLSAQEYKVKTFIQPLFYLFYCLTNINQYCCFVEKAGDQTQQSKTLKR